MPRANPPSVFNQKDPPPPVPPAEPGFNDFLAWMQFRTGEQAPAAPPPGTATQRSLLPKEQKKFHRAEADAFADKGSPSSDAVMPSADSAPSGAGIANPVVLGTVGGSSSALRKRRKAGSGGTSKGLQGLLLPGIALAAMLCVGFFVGRASAPRSSATAMAPIIKAQQDKGGPQAMQIATLINQAMAAEKKDDFGAATDLLKQVQKLDAHVDGLEYHLALLAIERADYPLAINILDGCIQRSEDVAASYNLRGTLTNRTGGINRGLDNLEVATHYDPFNAKYFYFLGEALRRTGKPQLALERLRQAADRLQEPALEGIYNLKIRLTQIELGRESEFADQLSAELQRKFPSVDWLFTAAALEMRRGNFDAASGYLDKAVATAEPRAVSARIRDFYFAGYADEKKLARFFTPDHPPETVTASGTAAPAASPSSPSNVIVPAGVPPIAKPSSSPHP